MFSLRAIVFRFALSTGNSKKKKQKITLRPTPDSTTQLQRRHSTIVAFAAMPRGVPTAATEDSWRSVALQSGPKRSPFGAYPAADQRDRRDDGDQHDAEQNRIFDERSAFLVTLELFDQLRHLTHVSLQFVLMPNALFARSSARTEAVVLFLVLQRAHKGLAAERP